MKTHEQLEAIRHALEADGWVRLNGNHWEDPTGRWRLRTAYTYQEATLTLLFKRVHGQPAWTASTIKPYRGANPVQWFYNYGPLLPADKLTWAKIRK